MLALEVCTARSKQTKGHNRESRAQRFSREFAEAQAAGKDHLTQTEEAVRAVVQAFPKMTASDALARVNRVRRQ